MGEAEQEPASLSCSRGGHLNRVVIVVRESGAGSGSFPLLPLHARSHLLVLEEQASALERQRELLLLARLVLGPVALYHSLVEGLVQAAGRRVRVIIRNHPAVDANEERAARTRPHSRRTEGQSPRSHSR